MSCVTQWIIILAQAKELEILRGTTDDVKTKMDELIKQNEGNVTVL